MRVDEPYGLHAFIDESYGKDDYYVGAVVITREQYLKLVNALADVQRSATARLGAPAGAELHAHRIMHGREPWSCLRGRVHEAVALYRDVLRAIVKAGAVVYVEGVDVPRLRARYRYPDPPYEVALRHLLERSDVLARTHGTQCAVTADLVDRHQDFAEAIAGYTRVGTPGFRPSRLERILDPQWVDSETSLGVQAADMVTYIIRRQAEVESSKSAQRATRSLVHHLRPAIRHQRKWRP